MLNKNLSIRSKLVIIILSITIIVTGLGFLIIITNEIENQKKNVISEISAFSKIFGEICISPLSFNDKLGAKNLLNNAISIPGITGCYIFEKNRKLFTYSSHDSTDIYTTLPDLESSEQFINGNIHVLRRIEYKDNFYGWIYVKATMGDYYSNIKKYIVKMLFVFLGILILTYFLAGILQKIISKPILELAEITKLISENPDLFRKIKVKSNDEIGVLYNGFNKMIEQIQLRSQERDKALTELSKSEDKYKTLFESTLDGIFLFDPEKGIISSNPAGKRMFALPNDDDLIISPVELSPEFQPNGESSQELAKKMINYALENGSNFYEWDHKTLEGKVFPATVLSTRIEIENKTYLLATVRDISKQKQNELEIKRTKNYINNIINSMPSVLIGVDSNGNVTQWNKTTVETTGIKPENAIGKQLADVFPQMAAEMGKIIESIKTRQIKKDTNKARTKDGNTFYENITIYPLIANGVEGAVIRVDDITEQVRLEEMMIQSEKMLSVGGLAAGMAHEINNPLAGIIQNIEVLQNRLLKDLSNNVKTANELGLDFEQLKKYIRLRKIDEMSKLIKDSGIRASEIVKNMLSFARKENSQKSLNSIPQLLDSIIDLAANDYDLKKNYDFKKIKIQKNYKDDLPLVRCESTKIQQVFLNIIKNAAEAMLDKDYVDDEPRLVFYVYKKGNNLLTEIIDNGPGIKEEIKNRIFEPFFTTKTVGKGTGLGMSVSYFIITQNHNGNMTVESVPNKWTKFSIYLPV